MVMNGPVVLRVAHVSADLCQYIACNPERLRSDQFNSNIISLAFWGDQLITAQRGQKGYAVS
ncbi:hypothetical protein RJ641_027373 [Dillenia turbinata]|uniref:Uncharacterized protein n=1 Tax=Dillenia turbinata TaxID=194707 RepID=A0AAN8W606_9MAGN